MFAAVNSGRRLWRVVFQDALATYLVEEGKTKTQAEYSAEDRNSRLGVSQSCKTNQPKSFSTLGWKASS